MTGVFKVTVLAFHHLGVMNRSYVQSCSIQNTVLRWKETVFLVEMTGFYYFYYTFSSNRLRISHTYHISYSQSGLRSNLDGREWTTWCRDVLCRPGQCAFGQELVVRCVWNNIVVSMCVICMFKKFMCIYIYIYWIYLPYRQPRMIIHSEIPVRHTS